MWLAMISLPGLDTGRTPSGFAQLKTVGVLVGGDRVTAVQVKKNGKTCVGPGRRVLRADFA